MNIAIKHHFTGEVICIAEIDPPKGATQAELLGLAAEWAVRNGIKLSCADLRGADLTVLDLTRPELAGVIIS